jgi:hypothetical protein
LCLDADDSGDNATDEPHDVLLIILPIGIADEAAACIGFDLALIVFVWYAWLPRKMQSGRAAEQMENGAGQIWLTRSARRRWRRGWRMFVLA